MSVEKDIAALKEAVGARTDMELAEKLGMNRSAIAQWKARGAIPEKYRLLYKQPTSTEVAEAAANAVRFHMFGKPQHAYWMMAAMATLPPDLFSSSSEGDVSRGVRLEQAVLSAMHLAMSVTLVDMQKQWCESRDDYEILVSILKEKYGSDLARIHAKATRKLG